ncbi:phenylacetate--CoA ligase family protein [Phaeobacter gallaeciensis]|uniref:phenylacetate--CoA ligase family protein n=1 Tax=Phaeobacter gallaeciensis TaxID=60890 RepID=UPI00237FBA86|nr:phenylacetate--CoA ligase family protein [Phaeobacter gallaeciensis]MDE4191899.1 phenylacetate--CoA ligase family protein [Phaeobacter gallaeciensis]MDE4200362.1 phenylacetate--CoA ligase family protein [Phaeobacter gallaeciensis]MDE4204514.1 phenylacetate--CoA ligase family protein [Phaeobacter gallaeciensis]MDE4208654.1 phenylacetate--CoA ligase family protein [Phaeobacter gallaeciensis]MDE4217275.1 phenylacetate--CoA ligase family protein [Phaeobacter gallaeciensis]
MSFFDILETRSADERAADIAKALPEQIARAKTAPGYGSALADVDPAAITSAADLAALPVLRKSELSRAQAENAPFGGFTVKPAHGFAHIFQSPGPIYEPGGSEHDWWRMGRFLHAAGIGAGDVVQNCFGYHLTPAGMIFESGARAVGAAVLPAGTGQTELQVTAARDVGATAYAGTPDFLKVILDKADAMGVKLGYTKAAVGGGALFPSLRQEYADRGITCLQSYATADLGNIAYESAAMEGMIVDERVIVEIVTPGTGTPVAPGEVGEVVVTTLNPDYPLIRFATGDLSAGLPGMSPCGRTNMRIKGWMGRADQTTKIKGMFVRPEQVAALVDKHDEIVKARVIATRDGEMDAMTVQIEATGGDEVGFGKSVIEVLKLKGKIEVVAPGALPKDGLVIEDQRSYD